MVRYKSRDFSNTNNNRRRITIVSPGNTLNVRSIRGFLLMKVKRGVRNMSSTIINLTMFFNFRNTNRPLPLPFVMVFGLTKIPMTFGNNYSLFSNLQRILSNRLSIPFRATKGYHVKRVKKTCVHHDGANIPMGRVNLYIRPNALNIMTSLSLHVKRYTRLLSNFRIHDTRVENNSSTRLATTLHGLPRLIRSRTWTTPLSGKSRRVGAINKGSLLFRLHMRLQLVSDTNGRKALHGENLQTIGIFYTFSYDGTQIILLRGHGGRLYPLIGARHNGIDFLYNILSNNRSLIYRLGLHLSTTTIILRILGTLLRRINRVLHRRLNDLHDISKHDKLTNFQSLYGLTIRYIVSSLFMRAKMRREYASLPFSFVVTLTRQAFGSESLPSNEH